MAVDNTRAARHKRWAQKIKSDPARKAKRNARQVAWAKQRRANPKTWATANIKTLRVRARARGISCTIVAADIAPSERCPICSRQFVFGVVGHAQSPSVDKRIPQLGYIKSNVSVICRRCNMCKQDETDPEVFERLAAYMRREI